MAELVTIPISTFEFSIDYERPNFNLLGSGGSSVVQALFDALKPWDPRIGDVEVISTGKLSEQGVSIKLPIRRVSFFVGTASCKFVQEGIVWQSMDETIAISDAADSALIRCTDVAVGPKNAAVLLHLQPRSLSFLALLAPFIPSQFANLNEGPAVTMATVVKWEHRKVTIDGSGISPTRSFCAWNESFPSLRLLLTWLSS